MKLPPRSEIPTAYTWDLSPLYPSVREWQTHLQKVETRLDRIGSFAGRLGESAAVLCAALECYFSLRREIERLYTFAALSSDEDTANSENLGRRDTAVNLFTRFSALASYIDPELLALEPARLEEFLREAPLLPYRRTIADVVRYRPYTLSPQEEQLLAQGLEVFSACDGVYSQLNNADLTFGTVEVDGVETPVTHGNFAVLLRHHSRDVRQKAFALYYAQYDGHRNTMAATLRGSVKRNVYLSRVKHYPSTLQRALFADNVSATVYDNLIAAVEEHLAPLHSYYALRKRVLKLDEQRLYDTYVPLVEKMEVKHPYEEACDIVLEALRPLGEEYGKILRRGLIEERWVDVLESRGKRSGAYSSGCYDSPPYMLLNYKEDVLDHVFTLAHEAGHSMHSYLSRQAQEYQDFEYTIFVAEVASTLNEQLLLEHLKRRYADNHPMLAYLTNHQLDELKGTLYRQTMFAEFEKQTHEIAERNEPLTIDLFRSLYGALLAKYFGPSVVLTATDSLECLRIPHFYSAFYVYKYATGISAAIALSERILAGEAGALDRYLQFLRAGCTKYPLELLADAGVDMTTPAPIASALKLFARLVQELDLLLTCE